MSSIYAEAVHPQTILEVGAQEIPAAQTSETAMGMPFEDAVSLGRIISIARSLEQQTDERIYKRLPLSSFHVCDGMPDEVRDSVYTRFLTMSRRLNLLEIGDPIHGHVKFDQPEEARMTDIRTLKRLGNYMLVEETSRNFGPAAGITYTFAVYPSSFIEAAQAAGAA